MKFQAIKGVRDILPPESALWNRVEQAARDVFGTFGFAEIRLPIFEQTELFARSVGAETDIVSKEMYSFIVKSSTLDLTVDIFRSGAEFDERGHFVKPEDKEQLEKERAGESLTLRPEATASVVRAYIEHGMQTRPGNVKLYYMGPMF